MLCDAGVTDFLLLGEDNSMRLWLVCFANRVPRRMFSARFHNSIIMA